MTLPRLRWRCPPVPIALADDEVHLWRANLKQGPGVQALLERTLSADELDRAGRFRFARDRDRFVVRRGLLRAVLARYLQLPPASIRFDYCSHGKPYLSRELAGTGVRFNLSHSGGRALFAITRGREVGVDLERVVPARAELSVARQFFALSELEALRQLGKHGRVEGFFNCWTRKEAYLKARGEGLSVALDAFQVSLLPGEPARLIRSSVGPDEPTRWRLEDLQPWPNYAGALAAEGVPWRLTCWEWPRPAEQAGGPQSGQCGR